MSGQYVEVRIKKEQFAQLVAGSEITGTPIQAMITEALESYIECDLSVLIETRAEETAQA